MFVSKSDILNKKHLFAFIKTGTFYYKFENMM